MGLFTPLLVPSCVVIVIFLLVSLSNFALRLRRAGVAATRRLFANFLWAEREDPQEAAWR